MSAQVYSVPGQAEELFGMEKHKSYELSLTWDCNANYY